MENQDEGTLQITSIQVGTIYINNQRVGRTPRFDIRLTPGIYWVKVYFPEFERTTGPHRITIHAGRTIKVHFDPSTL